MKVRVVVLGEVTPRDTENWRALAERAIEPNAFLDPRFLAPGGHLPEAAASTTLLFVEDETKLRAVMAFDVVERRIRGLRVRAVIPGAPFLNVWMPRWHPLVDPDGPAETLAALFGGMNKLGLPPFVDLSGFPADGPLAAALVAAAASIRSPFVERGTQDFAYRFRTGDESPGLERQVVGAPQPVRLRLDHLGISTRKRYAQYRRGLERDTGDALVIVDRGGDPAAMEEFLDLQAAGWKGDISRGGGALRVIGFDSWFADVASRFRADKQLSVFTLGTSTETVYMQVALRSGRGLFAPCDAYDEKFAKYRPGNLGRLAVLDHCITDTTVDFFDPNMHPRYVDSTQLYPDRRQFTAYLLAHHGVLPKSLVRSIPVIRRVRDHIKGR